MNEPLLLRGSRGDEVKKIQTMLGIEADGVFGKETHDAVLKFQREHHLKKLDGIVGPETRGALGLEKSSEPSQVQARPSHGHPHVTPTPDSQPTPPLHPQPVPTQAPQPPLHSAQASAVATGKWTLSAQMTGQEMSTKGMVIADGLLTLTDPQGHSTQYPFRSGGHRLASQQNMQETVLPGLEEHLRGGAFDARYQIDWSDLVIDSRGLHGSMKGPDGTGSWLRLGSIDTSRSGFGIHTDGPEIGGSYGDGTCGCVGLEPDVSKQFFAQVAQITRGDRPQTLDVLPPKTVTDTLARTQFASTITSGGGALSTAPVGGRATTTAPRRTV